MSTRKWAPVLLPFIVGLLGSCLDWEQFGAAASWREVLASVYYIPVVIAAISLGRRAAVIVALVAGGSHGLTALLGRGGQILQPLAETMLFLCVAVTTAKLADWLREQPVPVSGPNELSQEPLARSFNEAQDATEMSALGRVVVGLVRQFRTPVASIEGAGWVLQDFRLPDEKRQEFVDIIRKESHRLDRVLSDVLDYTRPRKPRFETISLAPLIDEVIQMATPKTHGPFFLFKAEIPADLPALRCDPDQIRQALLNLAMNAVQASPGGGQVVISARVEQNYAVIRIRDHGHGIRPSILEKIFDPFFTTQENSLGLGLPVALHTVAEHGGRIAVEATSDRGTCLSVFLPV